MARTFESKITSDRGTDTDEEIWKTIRYLDPDGELREGDFRDSHRARQGERRRKGN
jgi:hypothetical protein